MACPYFIPAQPHERELWPHRDRLPLGDGFTGRCGARLEVACCDDETLRLHCNLGYAELGNADSAHAELDHAQPSDATCGHLPADREFDAIRFQLRSVAQGSAGQGIGDLLSANSATLRVQFACERAHRPVLCGELRYDRTARVWVDPPDAWLLPLAEAAVRTWIARHR